MQALLIEATIIGFITFVIGTICFNLSINKNNNKYKDKSKPKGIGFAFYMTGVLLHIILNFTGFNNWFCNKKMCTNFK